MTSDPHAFNIAYLCTDEALIESLRTKRCNVSPIRKPSDLAALVEDSVTSSRTDTIDCIIADIAEFGYEALQVVKNLRLRHICTPTIGLLNADDLDNYRTLIEQEAEAIVKPYIPQEIIKAIHRVSDKSRDIVPYSKPGYTHKRTILYVDSATQEIKYNADKVVKAVNKLAKRKHQIITASDIESGLQLLNQPATQDSIGVVIIGSEVKSRSRITRETDLPKHLTSNMALVKTLEQSYPGKQVVYLTKTPDVREQKSLHQRFPNLCYVTERKEEAYKDRGILTKDSVEEIARATVEALSRRERKLTYTMNSRDPLIWEMIGVPGTGKTALAFVLIARNPLLKLIPNITTRELRAADGEIDLVHHKHVNSRHLERAVANTRAIPYTLFDVRYGVDTNSTETHLNLGYDPVWTITSLEADQETDERYGNRKRKIWITADEKVRLERYRQRFATRFPGDTLRQQEAVEKVMRYANKMEEELIRAGIPNIVVNDSLEPLPKYNNGIGVPLEGERRDKDYSFGVSTDSTSAIHEIRDIRAHTYLRNLTAVHGVAAQIEKIMRFERD